ncbi:MAG: class I SAM-dependent methyltransferase [Deltaproteobacteria bacterium]|nr:class I SAM-dependent methyltransferase [Deltaproteobacteria bacterium]
MDVEKTNTLTLLMLEKATAYHRWIFEEIQPFLKGNLLEVGCGTGNLTGLLLQQGRVMAVDLNEDYLRIVRERYGKDSNLIGTLIWNIESNPPEALQQPIDTIVCSNVLEHVEDDDIVLSHFYELLPEGGKLILLVPALKFLYNHLDWELGHCRRYGREELIQKMKRNRFRITHLAYFNFFGILGWYLNGTLLKRRLLPEGQMGMFNKMVPLFRIAEKMIPGRVGQSLIAVGEK